MSIQWFPGHMTSARKKAAESMERIDVVIEVLIAPKNIDVPTLSGGATISVPDMQATAINLKDAKILGQASSAEVMRRVPAPALGQFDTSEVTDATALALMDDMAPAAAGH